MFFDKLHELRKQHKAFGVIVYHEIIDIAQNKNSVYLEVSTHFCLADLSHVFWYNKPEGLKYEIIFWEEKKSI